MLAPEWKELAQMWLGLVTVVGVAALSLKIRDYVRIGRAHRHRELLRARGLPLTLPDGRVPCPECGEAIQPHARRCPFCREVVAGRL